MFDPDEIPAVLERASGQGVLGVLVPATGPGDLDSTADLARRHPDRIVGAIGVHPHEASSVNDEVKRKVEQLLTAAGIVAVGEIGLDYHYMNSPREDQLRALRWMLDVAVDADLPVVLHNRESWADLAGILADYRGRLRGVCHSFTEGPAAARRVVELGLTVGVSGMVTFNSAASIRDMVAALNPNEFMVETDSPYLAPTPHRGRRNEPGYVGLTGRRAAEVLGLDAAVVADATSRNFRWLFGVGDEWAVPGSPGSPSG